MAWYDKVREDISVKNKAGGIGMPSRGIVPGQGKGDKVLIRAEPGEPIVPNDIADMKVRDFLMMAINKNKMERPAGDIPGYQDGGTVDYLKKLIEDEQEKIKDAQSRMWMNENKPKAYHAAMREGIAVSQSIIDGAIKSLSQSPDAINQVDYLKDLISTEQGKIKDTQSRMWMNENKPKSYQAGMLQGITSSRSNIGSAMSALEELEKNRGIMGFQAGGIAGQTNLPKAWQYAPKIKKRLEDIGISFGEGSDVPPATKPWSPASAKKENFDTLAYLRGKLVENPEQIAQTFETGEPAEKLAEEKPVAITPVTMTPEQATREAQALHGKGHTFTNEDILRLYGSRPESAQGGIADVYEKALRQRMDYADEISRTRSRLVDRLGQYMENPSYRREEIAATLAALKMLPAEQATDALQAYTEGQEIPYKRKAAEALTKRTEAETARTERQTAASPGTLDEAMKILSIGHPTGKMSYDRALELLQDKTDSEGNVIRKGMSAKRWNLLVAKPLGFPELPEDEVEKIIARTGTDPKTGKKVIQYSDGTIDYAE